MRKKKDNLIISCPNCQTEYLIPEVFYQEDLVKVVGSKINDNGTLSSNIHDIFRDDDGKIKYYQQDEEPCYIEHWECEKCGCCFDVKITLIGEVVYDENTDTDDGWTSQEQ